jgi:hypothetical protein
MSDPLDYSDRYNTTLSPEEEAAFMVWAQKVHRLGDVRDYDLRGAFKANSQEAVNGHLPDTYKKPNHPTFSTDSIYNGVDGATGGQWIEEPKTKRWSYRASPYTAQLYGPAFLQHYFKSVEPDATLVLP